MRADLIAALLILPLLAACGGSGGGKVPSASVKAVPAPRQASRLPTVRKPVRQTPQPAQALVLPGLESVIGATANDLSRQFGAARLDVQEGDARKLQFSGTACVLDVYLYPYAAGREPQATYVDARRASDGKDVDRVTCITALRRR